MPQLFQNKVWQVKLPAGWNYRRVIWDGATIFRPDGIGILSVAVHLTDRDLPKELLESAEIFAGKLRGLYFAPSGSRNFMRMWWLRCKGRILVISYSCARSFADVESKEVDEILRNIEESTMPSQRIRPA